uniref:SUMO specific peptidase 7b n=1 Tax=Cyprinus carpio TaxID=7962 RepID=A0A8C1PPF1_CYPCA
MFALLTFFQPVFTVLFSMKSNYPPPPSKGGITVTTEDLECLKDGEFLNDVIIDFYLKYLLLERVVKDVAERSHIFSSFFYKQLTRKYTSSPYRRHQRVRTWTRHVDIFSKDYLFIPVNQEAHWYLVVICFPSLERPECVPWRNKGLVSQDGSQTAKASSAGDCQRGPTQTHQYLQVQWEVRKGSAQAFTRESISGSLCRVPLQDNSSDCGLYLLQYVESFLQNPVVHFDLPLRLEHWFPRNQVRRKREELQELVLQLYRRQGAGPSRNILPFEMEIVPSLQKALCS